MKQVDIFGNEIPLEEIEYKPLEHQGGRIPFKTKFRSFHGFKEGLYCKNCKYFEEHGYNRKTFFKCKKLGVSSSTATDIRKNDIACNLYERK